MILIGKCKKCGGEMKFDVGDMSREAIEKRLSTLDAFHCDAGKHAEMVGPMELFEFDWDNMQEGQGLTEKEFVENLKAQYKQVLSTDELTEQYNVESFMMGMCLTSRKDDESALVGFHYATSPEGTRYYFTQEG